MMPRRLVRHSKALEQMRFLLHIIRNRRRQIGQGDVGGRAISVQQYIVFPDAVRALFLKAHLTAKHGGGR